MSESLTALFDTVELVRHHVPGMLERVPLDQLELAPNHRKAIDRDGIHRLAHMLASTGQLTPCIGRRLAEDRVIIYAGQRRRLAARASRELAGTPDFERLAPVTSLIVLLLDHEPREDEIRRAHRVKTATELCQSSAPSVAIRDPARLPSASPTRVRSCCCNESRHRDRRAGSQAQASAVGRPRPADRDSP